MKRKSTHRDGIRRSAWESAFPEGLATGNKLREHYDVIIAGAGITGLTCGLLLQHRGLSCLIVEAKEIGSGTTGGTSAHLNTFLDATYPEIERDFGEEAALLTAKAAKEAFSLIKRHVKLFHIDADLEEKKAYLYAETEEQEKQLKEIYEASKRAGINVRKAVGDVPVSFRQMICFPGQAQFHPVKYIAGLAKAFVDKGGHLLEHTPFITDAMEEEQHLIRLGEIQVRADHLIYATHIPPGISLFNFRCAPYRSYVVAAKLKKHEYPDTLWYDMEEPYHYWRSHVIDGQPLLLVGGEDHKTGQGNGEEAIARLKEYVTQFVEVEAFKYAWSSQYYVPVDGLPYIGQMPFANNRTWVATGFNGNGMIWGTVGAKILADLISNKENAYARLLSPSRMKPVAGFTEFIQENANVLWRFVADRFTAEQLEAVVKMPPSSGIVVDTDSGKVAVHKTASGKIKAISAVCTHAGCIVNFNALEQSWDCPCHGGRYDVDGNVLTGPPVHGLEPLSWEQLRRED